MSFTTAELNLVNQSLGRIGATNISAAENGSATCNNYVQANLHYSHTRDALLRSSEWSFAVGQAELALISTITLDTQPLPDAWIVGDTITGLTSGVTAEILTVISPTEYEIIYISGTFTDGERITNATVYDVYWEGIPLTWEGETVTWHDEDDEQSCGTGYPVVASIAPAFQYDYQYQLPNDFSRLKANYEGENEWTIQGKRLLSNLDEVDLEYIKETTDPADFDALFYEVLVLQLALKLLGPLAGTQTSAFRQELQLELRDAMARARTVCAAETNTSGDSTWNNARFRSGVI